MKVTDFTRGALAFRRDRRDMQALGYQWTEGSWELHRGGKTDHRIVDVRISVDGKYIWFKTEKSV